MSLLESGERLFGIHGFDGTSMRRIGAEAGQANVSVVKYYFDSKADLASEILSWRVGNMEHERSKMLDKAKSFPPGQRLPDLVAAIYLPVLDFTNEAGEHVFARFLQQYMTTFQSYGVIHPEDRKGDTPALTAIVSAMNEELYFLEPWQVRMRFTKEMLGFLSLIIVHDQKDNSFLGHKPDLKLLIDDGLATSLCALRAPPPRAG